MTTTESKHQAVDFQAALAKVGGDLALLAELSELFCKEHSNMLTALQRAVADRNAASVRAAAHSLKGSLAVFSAKPATGLAARLEESAEAGQLAPASQILRELEVEIERVCVDLRQLTGAEACQSDAPRPARKGEEKS